MPAAGPGTRARSTIDLLWPTFVPGPPDGSGDQRKLGLMLFDASVRVVTKELAPPPLAPALERAIVDAAPDAPARRRSC